jgi:hypothetical protein
MVFSLDFREIRQTDVNKNILGYADVGTRLAALVIGDAGERNNGATFSVITMGGDNDLYAIARRKAGWISIFENHGYFPPRLRDHHTLIRNVLSSFFRFGKRTTTVSSSPNL